MTEIAPAEQEWLKGRIDHALSRGGLGTWEARFLQDMRSRLDDPPRLTEKQSRKLHDVLNRTHQPRQALFGHRMPWRRRPPARHRSSSPTHRLLRELIFLMVTVLFFGLHQLYLELSSRGTGTRAPETTIQSLQPSSPVPAARSAAGPAVPGANGPAATGGLPIVRGAIRVIDGDTVEVQGERFRLVGLNTPETFEPQCAAEQQRGTAAKERLRQLLKGGTPRLKQVPCACPPGTEGTSDCNHGRSCGVLSVDGTDVAQTLIGEGLAVAFHCGSTGCPPLPRPWCD